MKENSATGDYARGIDISPNQGVVDWNSAAIAGVLFGYVCATQGTGEQCGNFAENWREIKQAGLLRGAYHYFRPLMDPEAQAQHFGAVAGKLEREDLPPVLRLKAVQTHAGGNEWDGLRQERRIALVARCLNSIERNFGRKPIIFTNGWFLKSQLGEPGELTGWDLWIADYSKPAGPSWISRWADWKFWRHSEAGEIAGVRGKTGLDYFNGSPAELRTYAGAAEAEGSETADEEERPPVSGALPGEQPASSPGEQAAASKVKRQPKREN